MILPDKESIRSQERLRMRFPLLKISVVAGMLVLYFTIFSVLVLRCSRTAQFPYLAYHCGTSGVIYSLLYFPLLPIQKLILVMLSIFGIIIGSSLLMGISLVFLISVIALWLYKRFTLPNYSELKYSISGITHDSAEDSRSRLIIVSDLKRAGAFVRKVFRPKKLTVMLWIGYIYLDAFIPFLSEYCYHANMYIFMPGNAQLSCGFVSTPIFALDEVFTNLVPTYVPAFVFVLALVWFYLTAAVAVHLWNLQMHHIKSRVGRILYFIVISMCCLTASAIILSRGVL